MNRNKHVLMIRPSIKDFSAYDHFAQPLGFLSIATTLKKMGLTVSYLDCLARRPDTEFSHLRMNNDGRGEFPSTVIEKPSIFKRISRNYRYYGLQPENIEDELTKISSPDLILITTGMTYWYPALDDLLMILNRVFAGTPIVLGGIYSSLCSDHASKLPGFPTIFQGRVTLDFYRFVMDVLDLTFPLNALDLNASPDLSLPGHLEYAPFVTRWGCNHRCEYCAAHRINGSISPMSLTFIRKQLENIRRWPAINNIAIYDDDLGDATDNHFTEILKFIADENLSYKWHLPNALSANSLNSDVSYLLKIIGFKKPRLSLNYINLRLRDDGLDSIAMKVLEKASRLLLDAGYASGDISSYLLAGLPGQSLQGMKKAGDQLLTIGIRPYFAQFSPIPGTPLGDERLAYLTTAFNTTDLLLTNKILSPFAHEGWTADEYTDLANSWRTARI